MNIYPIYGNTAPTYQVVLIRDCPFSTCIAPVMGSSLPDDISIARTLGLGEKPLLIFSWSALWPPALCGCTDTSPRKGSSPSVPSPSALLWALHPRCLAALPTRFSLPRDDIIAGQRDKKNKYKANKWNDCKLWRMKTGWRCWGNWGRQGRKGSLSKNVIFELSPEGCEEARRTRGRAFQIEARASAKALRSECNWKLWGSQSGWNGRSVEAQLCRVLMVGSWELFSKFNPQILLSKWCYDMTYILVDTQ